VRGDICSEDNFFLKDLEVIVCVPLLAIELFLSLSQSSFNEFNETDKGKLKSGESSEKIFSRVSENSNHHKKSFIQGD
jgi:hypothetical protein